MFTLLCLLPSLCFAATAPVYDYASDIRTTTTGFNNNLNATHTDVQKALDAIDNLILESSGGGDVVSVGDCATGACFDGTSDGGTRLDFFNAGWIGRITVGSLSGARTWTLPDNTGTFLTTGSTTDLLPVGTSNLYFTNALARAAISDSVLGLDYSSSTGIWSLTSGYSIPTTTQTTNWNTAYGWGDHSSQNYFVKGIDDTDDVTEGTNLYFTTTRARDSISSTAAGLLYTNSTGVISIASGYVIPSTTEESNWNTAYSSLASKANLTGGNTFTGNQVINANLSVRDGIGTTSTNATDFREYNANGYYVSRMVNASQSVNRTEYEPTAAPTANGQLRYHNTDGSSYYGDPATGDSVAGNDMEVQVNINGSMGSDPHFRWDSTNKYMHIGNSTSGRGGTAFGDAYNGTDYKTGFTGADNATVNYLVTMPSTRPADSTVGLWYYTPNGNITRAESSGNVTYDKIDGAFFDATAFINATPGNSKYYGSDSGGVLGYFDLPSGGTGNVTYANVTEVNTGTETAKAISPDALAGSNAFTKGISICGQNSTTANVTTGNVYPYFVVPVEWNGMNLVSVGAHVKTASSSGAPTFQLHRNRAGTIVNMLSTALTIDATELDSKDATTAAVIDTSNDDLQTGDELYWNVTTAGTGTQGQNLRLGARLP